LWHTRSEPRLVVRDPLTQIVYQSAMALPPPLTARYHPSGALIDEAGRSTAGIEWLRAMMEHRVADPPIVRMTGLRYTDVGLGLSTMAMPASAWWQTGAGVFFAGTLSFLADGPLGGAVLTTAGAGIGMTTSELSIDFLRPATIRSGTLIGRGRLIHSTRSQGLSEVFLEDSQGRMLAHGTSRCILFPLDPSAPLPELDLDPDGPELHRLGVEGSAWGREYWNSRSGPEVLTEMVEGKLTAPLMTFAGLQLNHFSDGTATVELPASPWFSQAFGTVFGGITTLLAEFTATCACLSTVPAATSFSPLDMKINFLRPVLPDGSNLIARSNVIHRGRAWPW
jgi:uncharacterized protein (TIGR00369 family)